MRLDDRSSSSISRSARHSDFNSRGHQIVRWPSRQNLSIRTSLPFEGIVITIGYLEPLISQALLFEGIYVSGERKTGRKGNLLSALKIAYVLLSLAIG